MVKEEYIELDIDMVDAIKWHKKKKGNIEEEDDMSNDCERV